jgi:2-iminobutanoate/2-iminopropanoate deaminase
VNGFEVKYAHAMWNICTNNVGSKGRGVMKLLIAGLAVCVSCFAQSATFAQEQTQFKKENFSYNEWTKGKISEVVTVTNPGKIIFLAGIGPEREGDGKIVEEGNFIGQCNYAYGKIKKLLALQGATMNDVVRIVTYITDIRFFQDALKCRREAFGDAPIPASTLLNVPQLAWPYMMIEVDVTAMLAK